MLQAEFDLLIRTLGLLDSLVDDELGERFGHLSLDLSEVFLGEVQIDRLFGDRVKQVLKLKVRSLSLDTTLVERMDSFLKTSPSCFGFCLFQLRVQDLRLGSEALFRALMTCALRSFEPSLTRLQVPLPAFAVSSHNYLSQSSPRPKVNTLTVSLYEATC